MIRCDKDAVELSGSTHELIDNFVNICRGMAATLDRAKARPDVDVWEMIGRMVKVARREKYNADIYDLSALGRQGGRGG